MVKPTKGEGISVSEIYTAYFSVAVQEFEVVGCNIYDHRSQDVILKSKVRSIIRQNRVAVLNKTVIKSAVAKTSSPIEVSLDQTSKPIDSKVMELLVAETRAPIQELRSLMNRHALSKFMKVPDTKLSELAAGQIYRVENIFQRSSRNNYSNFRLANFVSNMLYVYKVEVGTYLEEARKLMLEVIKNARNAAKKYFIENYNVITMSLIADVQNNRREEIVNQAKYQFYNDWLMMLDSLLKKKHLPFGFVMDEEKSTSGVFSAAGSVFSAAGSVFSAAGRDESMSYFQSMLLKMLKRGPQEMLESFQSEVTEHTDGGGKRITRLSKVTREIRAKMRIKTEKERAGWGKGSDDEC